MAQFGQITHGILRIGSNIGQCQSAQRPLLSKPPTSETDPATEGDERFESIPNRGEVFEMLPTAHETKVVGMVIAKFHYPAPTFGSRFIPIPAIVTIA